MIGAKIMLQCDVTYLPAPPRTAPAPSQTPTRTGNGIECIGARFFVATCQRGGWGCFTMCGYDDLAQLQKILF
jgi:hypothetical protein